MILKKIAQVIQNHFVIIILCFLATVLGVIAIFIPTIGVDIYNFSILSYPIKGWIILLSSIFIIHTIYHFIKKVYNGYFIFHCYPKYRYDNFKIFNNEKLDSINWLWKWKNGQIINLSPVCPTQGCSNHLLRGNKLGFMHHISGGYIKCDRCDIYFYNSDDPNKLSYSDIEDRVKTEIFHRKVYYKERYKDYT